MAIWPPKVENKLFSWALVHQVATCHFQACVYRRSFYRIFNALDEWGQWTVTHVVFMWVSSIHDIHLYRTWLYSDRWQLTIYVHYHRHMHMHMHTHTYIDVLFVWVCQFFCGCWLCLVGVLLHLPVSAFHPLVAPDFILLLLMITYSDWYMNRGR